VVEQDGKFWCEHDARSYDSAVRRYVMNMQVVDFTGQQHVNCFNDQGVEILGTTADALSALKEVRSAGAGQEPRWLRTLLLLRAAEHLPPTQADDDAFGESLRAPRWGEWVLELMARPKEYNGNTRMRLNARTARRLDYASDAAALIQSIMAAIKG